MSFYYSINFSDANIRNNTVTISQIKAEPNSLEIYPTQKIVTNLETF